MFHVFRAHIFTRQTSRFKTSTYCVRAALCLALSILSLPHNVARADAMNALAFSNQAQTQPSEQALFQAQPTQMQRLKYAQQTGYNAPPPLPAPLGLNTEGFDLPMHGDTQRKRWQANALDNGAPIATYEALPQRSNLEEMYSTRILEKLEQFGYDFLQDNKTEAHSPAPLGLVGDQYILGVGDSLNIALTGQRNAHYNLPVDSNGQIQIPTLHPLNAAGQSLGSFKAQIAKQFQEDYNQSFYVALSEMRQAAILIAGHVKQPGRITLSNQHNVIDALMQAGGIGKTGTLRQIRLVRDGQVTMIDLYTLLLHGTDTIDLNIKDGDRIIVPPIGPTIAIAGDVKRSGIYEALPVMQGMWHQSKQRSQQLALNDLLDMSGGLLSPGKIRYLKLDMQLNGDEGVSEIDDPFARVFGDGSILSVVRGAERREGTIEVKGHARADGIHALSINKTLHSLLDSDRILGKDIYPLIAVIERWNRKSLSPEYISFAPLMVLQNKFDAKLQDGDVIHFFSHQQIAAIHADAPEDYFTQNKTQRKMRSAITSVAYGAANMIDNGEELVPLDIINVLKERSLFMRGAVRRKGHYPVSSGINLENVLAVAGGMTLEADKRNIEITRREDSVKNSQYDEVLKIKRRTISLANTKAEHISVRAGDTIRVNQKFQKITDNHVQIIGEVKNAGRYDLMAGDTMLSLIERAGGLNKYAYPEGAIFSRKSERHIEAQQYKAQARSLELSLASKMQTDKPPNDSQVDMTRQLITQLENTDTVGRITVEANPDILATAPELNMLLERGDRIYIPKRPLTVRVTGETLSPASLQFRSEKRARDYIREAGGYTRSADKDRTFVVYPDGSAQPLHLGNWTHSAPFIPPGSTLVVPHDPKPFNFLDSAKDITQIFTNLAVTGFLVSEIQDE
jgi:protein involved in polysaccharide export with SLBB domain|tara:strand:+ start:1342 stop:4062 length:2721 start_codon:yes stop_codon:yes gene_type:complete